MTATNHVVTGALIAAVVKRPELALPLAFLSHFVLDMLPHFGWKDTKSKSFFAILGTDMILAAGVLVLLLVLQPVGWPLLVASGILAASPDLLWLYYLIFELQNQPKKRTKLALLLGRIQWSETVFPGLFIEIAWLVSTGTTLLVVLYK